VSAHRVASIHARVSSSSGKVGGVQGAAAAAATGYIKAAAAAAGQATGQQQQHVMCQGQLPDNRDRCDLGPIALLVAYVTIALANGRFQPLDNGNTNCCCGLAPACCHVSILAAGAVTVCPKSISCQLLLRTSLPRPAVLLMNACVVWNGCRSACTAVCRTSALRC
jgi:hypothetical protein